MSSDYKFKIVFDKDYDRSIFYERFLKLIKSFYANKKGFSNLTYTMKKWIFELSIELTEGSYFFVMGLGSKASVKDNWLPEYYIDYNYSAFNYVESNRFDLRAEGIFEELFYLIIKEFKDSIVELEVQTGYGIEEGFGLYYYCKSFYVFLEAVVYQRWGYDIRNNKVMQEKVINHLKDYNALDLNGSVLAKYDVDATPPYSDVGVTRIVDLLEENGIEKQEVDKIGF